MERTGMRRLWRGAVVALAVAGASAVMAAPNSSTSDFGASDNPQPAKPAAAAVAPRQTTDSNGTAAKSVAPAVNAQNLAAEKASEVQPTRSTPSGNDTREKIATAPAAGLGQGSNSPAYDAAQKPAVAPRLGVDAVYGHPDSGEGLQPTVTPIGREAHNLIEGLLNPMMISISVFVLALLGYVMFRFRASKNPVASRTSHNTAIEVAWTLGPVLILAAIAVPSFRLLANQYDPPKAGLTIKATGHQWYWEYNYPDYGDFSFDAIMKSDKEAKATGTPRLLDTDNRVVVPVGVTVKVLTTGADVIHGWTVPAFWVQMDAVPGRINETWFKAERPGLYFGQCYQICGTKHGFMPIAIEVVDRATFLRWIAAKQKENGIKPVGPGIVSGTAVPPSIPALPTTTAAATPAAAPAA